MKVAVIGGGIFGITAATRLAKDGHKVDLFERNRDILQEASGINQFRLHRGHHYPRSKDTVFSLLKAEPSFRKEYGGAVMDDIEHFYCIAKNGSLTAAKDYINFFKEHGFRYKEVHCDLVNKKSIDLCVRVDESLIDPRKLKNICWDKLKKSGVRVRLGRMVTIDNLHDYDINIVATYSRQNHALKSSFGIGQDYQYEVCEKPVVRLQPGFNKKSIVIMDGPFMCADPFGDTGLFILGNVVHAIHETNIGKHPLVSNKLKPLLNRGVIKNPPISNFKLFIESGSEFIPDLKRAKHVGSMFTIRTVLPYLDKTDSRPTKVSSLNHRVISVFSGKIANCVDAADEVAGILREKLV